MEMARRMKIAFIINDLSGGGAEKALQLLSTFLVGRGHEVKVITLQSGNDAYALDPRIESATLASGRLSRGAGKVAALPLQAREIAALLRTWQPDIRVSILPRANVAHVMSRWFGNRGRILLTEQNSSRDSYPSNGIGDRLMRYLIRTFYPKADGVFPSSGGVMEGLKAFGVSEARMQVVYNAIVLDDIQSRAREVPEALPPSELPTVITVGRHAEQKDHETLIRAFALARQRVPARLVFVGQGPLREDLEALARELGVADSIVFAGWQPNPFAWLAQSDLFVLSSRYEGFGNVIVEAMACGLPIISTDCPSGPSEILRDGEAGMLVPVGDVEALADAMTTVLTDEALRAELAEKASRRAPDFDLSVIGPQYEAFLRSYAQADLQRERGSGCRVPRPTNELKLGLWSSRSISSSTGACGTLFPRRRPLHAAISSALGRPSRACSICSPSTASRRPGRP